MKKASLIASAAIVTAALSAIPVFAQGGPFADVPTDHWAYAAVDKLQKKGIVIGYPDQTYGGKRSMTRYEFAVAIARLLDQTGTGGATPIDTSQFVQKSELDQFAKKSDLSGFATPADVDALRKLIREFQPELVTLGVDLDAAKKRIDALDARVKALEADAQRIKITGTLSAYSVSNQLKQKDTLSPFTLDSVASRKEFDRNPTKTSSFVDYNGYQVGQGVGHNIGLLGDTYVTHDLDLNIAARLNEKASAEATINVGNYLNYLGSVNQTIGQRSNREAFGAFPGQRVSLDEDITLYKAIVSANFGPVAITVGRNPFQLTPYTLKGYDVDLYHDNDKTDLGYIPMDGITGTFKIGPVNLTGFADKVDPIKYVSNINDNFASQRTPGTTRYGVYAGARTAGYNSLPGLGFASQSTSVIAPNGETYRTGNRPVGTRVSPGTNGAMFVEQLAGGRASVVFGKNINVGGTYLSAGGSTAPGNVTFQDTLDRVDVYGGDISFKLGSFAIGGEYSKSDSYGQESSGGSDKKLISKDNAAYDASAKFNLRSLEVTGGYREIGPYFSAPGFWGGLGTVVNPVDIKGPYVNGTLRLGGTFSVFGNYQDYKGTGKAENNGGLTKDDKMVNLGGGVNVALGAKHTIRASYDQVEYHVLSANGNDRVKPRESYTDITYGYKFSSNSTFKVGYEFVKWDDKDSGFDTINGDGNVLYTSFGLKF